MNRQLQSDKKRMIKIWKLVKVAVKEQPDTLLSVIRHFEAKKHQLVQCPMCRTCRRCVQYNFKSLCDRYVKYQHTTYREYSKGIIRLINDIIRSCQC